MIYVAGSLRNKEVPRIAQELRQAGHVVFDDWFACGPEADDRWKDYEVARGRTYIEALKGDFAQNTFRFDRTHLALCDAIVLVLPAGKSAHLELGWVLGLGKPGYILLPPDNDRFDVMYNFATQVVSSVVELLEVL